ncbi:MAG: FAD-dependent oxidoreductase [Ferruginibacter sp.]
MAHTIIIGGGFIGLCSAYYLQKAGQEVTVIERNDITDGCSFGNMGYMSPSHFVPLASPGIIAEGFKYMLSSSSPFYIKPRLNLDLLQWAWHFYKSSTEKKVKASAPHLNNILQLSRQLINDMRAELGDGFDMEEKGCFMLCKSEKALEHEFHLGDDAEKLGLAVERLRRAEVQALEPDVEMDVAGALLVKDDCHFHPGRLMLLLKENLQKKGIQFRLHTTVTGFERSSDRVSAVITDKEKIAGDHFVIAAGSWIPQVTKMLDIKLLLQPGKGYSYTYDHVEKNIRYPAILVDGRCAITPWGHRLRIGGTMELSGINQKVLVSRMQGIYDSAKSFYPGLQIDFPPADKIWNGLRPVTPDGLPYIGFTKHYKNVIVAGGHAMLGISEGPGTGLLVTQLIQGSKPEIDMEAFRVERF